MSAPGVIAHTGEYRKIKTPDPLRGDLICGLAPFPHDVESDGLSPGSKGASLRYLHHLHKSGEMLGAMLTTEHNLWFYQALMAAMREAIGEGWFAAFAADFDRSYNTKTRSS